MSHAHGQYKPPVSDSTLYSSFRLSSEKLSDSVKPIFASRRYNGTAINDSTNAGVPLIVLFTGTADTKDGRPVLPWMLYPI